MVLLTIGNIDEVQMTFECKFFLELRWIDFRLKYKGIFGYHKNLNRHSASELWIPDLSLANTIGTPSVLSSEQYAVWIDMKGLPKLPNRRQLHESWIFDGSENPLVFSDVRDETLSCNFELTKYPFDTQTCSIVIRVRPSKKSTTSLLSRICTVSEDIKLTQYEIIATKGKVIMPDNYTFMCDIVLKRNPAFHLVSTYLPTLTLMIMALATLFIDESHVEATIMVAMTSMLVMFTLHQNVQSLVPYTAYLKFVDFWLIYGTILPFIVFIVQAAWELGLGDKRRTQNQIQTIRMNTAWELRDNKTQNLIDTELPKKNYYKILPKYGLPVLTFIFVIGYTVIAIYLQYWAATSGG